MKVAVQRGETRYSDWVRSLIVALAPLVLSACSPIQTLNAITPLRGLKVETNLNYGTDARQTLDVYVPQNAQKSPMVVFIHGGSWTGGDKSEHKFVGESFARAGYVTSVINYRLAPQNRYPAFIQDSARAIAWIREHAKQFGGDPNHLFVIGHSSGGFNALEVTMNERWLREVNVPVRSVRGVVGIAGPYDYDFRELPSRNAFPEGSKPEQVMPARHVRDNPPPTLLLVAGKDQVVYPENATKMRAALERAGGNVELRVIPNADHYTIVGALSTRLSFLNPVRSAVLEFLSNHEKES